MRKMQTLTPVKLAGWLVALPCIYYVHRPIE